MKIAALILGILAGLSGLPVATMGHALVGAGGGSGGSILYLLPIASFLGAGLALNAPAASGALLLLSALFWFILGAQLGYGVNIITIGALALNGVAGFLALAAWGQENSSVAEPTSQLLGASTTPSLQVDHSQAVAIGTSPSTPFGSATAYQYDQAKWKALVEFDPEIARIESTLRPYGQKYVDQFAAGYLILNDKAYIQNIIQKVIETARQDAAEAKAAEARWAKRFSDPSFIIKLADEKLAFLGAAPFGHVAILKDGQTLVERNGSISKFQDATAVRAAARDQSQWMPIDDPAAKLRLVKLFAPHVPGMTG